MTGMFYEDIERDMGADRERALAFAIERARIAAIDDAVNALADVLQEQGVSKAEVARRIGIEPSAMRRLFSSGDRNPRHSTLATTAAALGYRFELVPIEGTSHRKPSKAEMDAAKRAKHGKRLDHRTKVA